MSAISALSRQRLALGEFPPVAPHDACYVCLRGDTRTAVMVTGETEFLIAVLMKLGLPEAQAISCIAPDKTAPDSDIQGTFLVCDDCGKSAGVKVGKIGGKLPNYVQPDGLRDCA